MFSTDRCLQTVQINLVYPYMTLSIIFHEVFHTFCSVFTKRYLPRSPSVAKKQKLISVKHSSVVRPTRQYFIKRCNKTTFL